MLTPPFTLTTMLTGFFFAAFGFWLYYYPPKNINYAVGYRTPSSMRNQQTWDVANKYAAKIMLATGIVLFLSGILSMFIPFLQNLHVLIGVGLIVIAALLIMLLTELHLDKIFKKDGTLKTNEADID